MTKDGQELSAAYFQDVQQALEKLGRPYTALSIFSTYLRGPRFHQTVFRRQLRSQRLLLILLLIVVLYQ